MAATSSWPRTTLRRPGYPDLGLRVSDAERTDIADRLAHHYGEGRLDITEFDERVTRAMSAKTVGDFQGLFDDLPDVPRTPVGTLASAVNAAGTPAAGSRADRGIRDRARRQRRRGRRRGLARMVLMAVLVIVAASIAWHAVTNWIGPVMWLAILAAIILIVSRVRRR
jgi:Domain of unknown function (DUF1707)